MVKTPPFHGGNTGSNPVRVIYAQEKKHIAILQCAFCIYKNDRFSSSVEMRLYYRMDLYSKNKFHYKIQTGRKKHSLFSPQTRPIIEIK